MPRHWDIFPVFVRSAIQYRDPLSTTRLMGLVRAGPFLTTAAIFLMDYHKLLPPGLYLDYLNAIIASPTHWQITQRLISISNEAPF